MEGKEGGGKEGFWERREGRILGEEGRKDLGGEGMTFVSERENEDKDEKSSLLRLTSTPDVLSRRALAVGWAALSPEPGPDAGERQPAR